MTRAFWLLIILLSPRIAAAAMQETPAPALAAFVYIEPFEIRAEFVARADALTSDDAALSLEAQASLQRRFLATLSDLFVLTVAGEPVSPTQVSVDFITVDPVSGPAVDRRTSIPQAGSFVAAVYVVERAGLPRDVSLSFREMPELAPVVPVEFEAITGMQQASDDQTITEDALKASWTLPTLRSLPGLQDVAPVPQSGGSLPMILAGLFGAITIAGTIVAVRIPRIRTGGVVAAVVGALLALGAFAGSAPSASSVSESMATRVVEALLANTYHAFAYRDEQKIFDTLAKSVDGPLLEQLYLDIRRGLEDAEDGGPRVKVLRVAVLECDVKPDGRALVARVLWASDGDVSHWGHSHRRRNQYRGDLRIEPIDGAWRLTDVEILEEERI